MSIVKLHSLLRLGYDHYRIIWLIVNLIAVVWQPPVSPMYPLLNYKYIYIYTFWFIELRVQERKWKEIEENELSRCLLLKCSRPSWVIHFEAGKMQKARKRESGRWENIRVVDYGKSFLFVFVPHRNNCVILFCCYFGFCGVRICVYCCLCA